MKNKLWKYETLSEKDINNGVFVPTFYLTINGERKGKFLDEGLVKEIAKLLNEEYKKNTMPDCFRCGDNKVVLKISDKQVTTIPCPDCSK